MTERYRINSGKEHGLPTYRWVLVDAAGRVIYFNDDRRRIIAQAQWYNGFRPVNGSDQTYIRQIAV